MTDVEVYVQSELIRKREATARRSNLGDYDAARASFTWAAARRAVERSRVGPAILP